MALGTTIAHTGIRRFIIHETFLSTTMLAGALLIPTVVMPVALQAQDHKSYHDKRHNDDHDWNDHEDRAYRLYLKQNHRKYREFSGLRDNQRKPTGDGGTTIPTHSSKSISANFAARSYHSHWTLERRRVQ